MPNFGEYGVSRKSFPITPVVPQIQVTLNCNLDCVYCYESHHPGIISLKVVDSILKKTVLHNQAFGTTAAPVQVYWHGGEPLLAGIDFFKSVVEIQAGFQGVEFDNRIQTNATLMTDELAQLFCENDFSVGFSLDGPQDLHDMNRRFCANGKGSFEATMAGIECFRKHIPDKQISTISVITKPSLARVSDLYNFFNSIVARVQLDIYDLRVGDLLRHERSEKQQDSLVPSPEAIGHFLVELFDMWFYDPDGNADFSELRQEVKLALRPAKDFGDPFDKKRCDFRRVIFDPQGNSYSCDQYINNNETSLGNIKDTSIPEILEKKNRLWRQIKEVFRGSSSQMACGACKWGRKCSGGCLTCLKYNAALCQAQSGGNSPKQWSEIQLPQSTTSISGETYYCQGLKYFREHVKKAVEKEQALNS